MSAKSDMSQLVRMMPLAVVIPSVASLGMLLPPSGKTSSKDHRPFANPVTIAKMEDRIDVMVSMQKPKKASVFPSLPERSLSPLVFVAGIWAGIGPPTPPPSPH